MANPLDIGWVPLYSTGITSGTINANAAAQPQPSLLAALEASDPSLISDAPLNSQPSTGVNPAPVTGIPAQFVVTATNSIPQGSYVNDPNIAGAAQAQPQNRSVNATVGSSKIVNPA
jgi:hypothetical protein